MVVNMLKTRQCLLGIRTFLGVTSRIWGFIMYILRKHLRTVRKRAGRGRPDVDPVVVSLTSGQSIHVAMVPVVPETLFCRARPPVGRERARSPVFPTCAAPVSQCYYVRYIFCCIVCKGCNCGEQIPLSEWPLNLRPSNISVTCIVLSSQHKDG